MDKEAQRTVVTGVVTAVATALVMAVIGFFAGVFERGTEAISEDQIEEVMRRVMVTDAGKSYAQTLSEVNGNLIAIDTKVEIIQGDVDKLERAVRELAQ